MQILWLPASARRSGCCDDRQLVVRDAAKVASPMNPLVALNRNSRRLHAYIVCGVLMAFLALTGWVRKVMELVPMPIVMGMVSFQNKKGNCMSIAWSMSWS